MSDFLSYDPGFCFSLLWSCTRGIRQIWLQVSEESIIIQESCHIFAMCWNLLSKYDNFRFYFLGIWKKNWSIIFHKNSFYFPNGSTNIRLCGWMTSTALINLTIWMNWWHYELNLSTWNKFMAWMKMGHLNRNSRHGWKWDTSTEIAHINEIEDMDSICIKLFKWM